MATSNNCATKQNVASPMSLATRDNASHVAPGAGAWRHALNRRYDYDNDDLLLKQRSNDREMLMREQAARVSGFQDAMEKGVRDIALEQALPVLVNTVGTQIASSGFRPTNQRKSRL